MSPPSSRPRRLVTRYLDWIWAHHALVLVLTALVAGVAAFAASRLELRTDLAELLPSQDPAVQELRRISRRIGGTEVLEVGVDSPDRDANLRFAAALTARIRALPPRLVQLAAYEVKSEHAFLAAHRWLYADLDALTELERALRARIDQSKNPLLMDVDATASPDEITRRLRARAERFGNFPSEYFEGEGGHLFAIVVRPPGGLFGEHVGEELFRRVNALVAELKPESFHPAMKVGLCGPIVAELEERAALENDLVWATAVCVFLVCLVVMLFRYVL